MKPSYNELIERPEVIFNSTSQRAVECDIARLDDYGRAAFRKIVQDPLYFLLPLLRVCSDKCFKSLSLDFIVLGVKFGCMIEE